ncbi:hypothetical protein OG481_01905 [Streptomyces longwoodensis]|uniref:hypothetical protein n=1 Tax=Streptomyces longwoodensis TaxID=68231 RepID=UPI002DD8EEBB|nr:hypothetical protein [Streptomyces longwoodensis]WRY87346.1 hypothetical protein OG481_01905 [Streptomyces longwoodensis]
MTDRAYPADRLDRYVAALNDADTYAQLSTPADRERFARAVMAVADAETDPVYRSGYRMGRAYTGADAWDLAGFVAVFTTSDGSDCPATELRHQACTELVQGVGPHDLIDLMALAARHECPTPRKDGAL